MLLSTVTSLAAQPEPALPRPSDTAWDVLTDQLRSVVSCSVQSLARIQPYCRLSLLHESRLLSLIPSLPTSPPHGSRSKLSKLTKP